MICSVYMEILMEYIEYGRGKNFARKKNLRLYADYN